MIRKSLAQMNGETHGISVRQTVEDSMAEQPSWAKEGLVDVGDFAVDGADDLEAEEVG